MSGQAFAVTEQYTGYRLDRYLAEQCRDLSRSQLKRMIQAGSVQVDLRSGRPSDRLIARQKVTIDTPEPIPTGIVATSIPLEIVRETAEFVIVNKPAGLVVHPAPGHPDDTLANALMARHPGLTVGNALRPGIVHRLDKGTSGLMVVALSDGMYLDLIGQMKRRAVHKEYIALVHGRLKDDTGTIEAPIGRDRRDRLKMAIVSDGREARTHFRVLKRFSRHTLVRLTLETGRTHQIRVHLSSIGHPIVGDVTYGARVDDALLNRPFLHAWYLGFEVPGEGACAVAWAVLPPDLELALGIVRADSAS